MTSLVPYVGPNPGYGSIGPNFGSTNLDNIPSSGGVAGYTSNQSSLLSQIQQRYAGGIGVKSYIDPVTGMPSGVPGHVTFADGTTSTGTSTSGVNTTQSGTVDPTLAYLAQLYANQFQAPSAASTSGQPVVVVPQGQSAPTDTGAGTPAASKFLVFGIIAALAYFGYKWYKRRNG